MKVAMKSLVGLGLFLIVATLFAGQPRPLKLAIAKSFLVDQPKAAIEIATEDFKDVLKRTTGLSGEITSQFAAPDIAERLNSKQIDFGIFHAHEFAWLQKKYPQLRPVLLVADKHYFERAYLIVHQNNPAKSFADLRGKKLDMPAGTNEHCRIYLDKICGGKDQGPATFFDGILKSPSLKDALDDVARGKVQAAIADRRGLEYYREVRGPVYDKNLRVLQQSEEFPPAVLVCKEGAVEDATLKQFREGLLKAHAIPEGRDLMKTWKVEAFQVVRKDFEKSLADVLKAYPPP